MTVMSRPWISERRLVNKRRLKRFRDSVAQARQGGLPDSCTLYELRLQYYTERVWSVCSKCDTATLMMMMMMMTTTTMMIVDDFATVYAGCNIEVIFHVSDLHPRDEVPCQWAMGRGSFLILNSKSL